MSDFLAALAARTLGKIPAVEPRPRALFEPDRAGPPGEPIAETSVGLFPRQTAISDAKAYPHSVVTDRVTKIPSPPPTTGTRELTERMMTPSTSTTPLEKKQAGNADCSTTTFPVKNSGEREAPVSKTATITSPLAGSPPTARQSHPLSPREKPAMAPTVHISIGRVVVRAVHRAEPAREQRPTGGEHRSTLEAYLRQTR